MPVVIQFRSQFKPSKTVKNQTRKALQALLQKKDLGFHQLPMRDLNWSSAETMARQLIGRGGPLVVLGMGGSALGGQCLTSTVGPNSDVHFLYNTDPVTFEKLLGDRQLLHHAQFLLISKSGNTLELACMIDILQSRLTDAKRDLKSAVSVITEPKPNALRNWAESQGLLIGDHPIDVGGRFSVLTPVGLVPAMCAGVSLQELRNGAIEALETPKLALDVSAFYYMSFKRKEQLSVFWFYVDQLREFGPWLTQLWAESLGKKTKGPWASTPTTLSGTCDQHSALQQLMGDKIKRSICFVRSQELEKRGPTFSGHGMPGFSYLKEKSLGYVFATQAASTEEALRKTGRTTCQLNLEKVDAKTLGHLLMTFELVIGILGELLKINAFDQPGVELGKKITKKRLEK